MAKITCDLRILKAVALAASDSMKRAYHLEGVCVESHGDHAIMVATDGGILLAARVACDCGSAPTVLVPSTLIKSVKVPRKSPRKSPDGVIAVNDGNIAISCDDVTVTGRPIDGAFPDWRRVIPCGSRPFARAHYDAKYLTRIYEMTKALDVPGESVALDQYGVEPALFTITHPENTVEIIGVLTPMRLKPHVVAPTWASV